MAACATLVMCGAANAQTWTGNAPAEGTFFLYNVGAEKFINNGDPNEEWGTNAYLQAGFGLDIKLEANNGAYNLNTNVSNGGSSHYLATSTWCDGAATPWTFTAVEGQNNTYTISDGTSYLVANEALNDIVYGASTGDSKSWWKLVSLDDFKTAMQAKAYSATEPMDVSVFIQGRSFARNDGRNSSWTTTHDGGNWTWIGASVNKYYGNEAWNNTFSVSQTIENLPDGTYELKCSGFGTNGTTYIFANNTSKAIQTDNTTSYGTNKEAKWKAIHEDNAFAGQTTGKFTLSGGTLNLGLKRETNKSGDWCVYDEFRLYYYGLDLSEFAATLAAAVAEAEAVEGTVPTAAYTTLAAVVTEKNKTYTTASEYTAAANAIVEATTSAKALQAPYASYKSLKDAVLAISNDLNIAEAESAAEAATTVDNLTAAQEALRTALKTYLKTTDQTNIDLTAALLINPSFENGFSSGWTNNGMSIQNNTSFEKDGNNYCEKWQPNGTFSVKQTITLPAGVYSISAKVKARGVTSAKLLGNGIETAVTVQEATGTYTVQFACDDNAAVEFGFEGIGTGAGNSWLCVDDFHLTLVSAGLPDVTAVTGKMNAEVATAQTTAIETYYANKTIANYNAASAAIAAAEASVTAYAKMPQAITDATALKNAHNFVTPAAATTFAEAIAAAQTGYDEGTLTDAEANNYANLGVSAVGWHNPRAEDDWTSAEVYMKSAGFNAEFNDWSVEGVADGSDYLVPFFQDWIADGKSLGAKTMTGSLANLGNGLYKVSAWVRVRAKDGTAATGATGITMDVNGGTATDVTEGTQVGETQFQLAIYEAEGIVKDGILNVNFNIAEDNNISWLSFKNISYIKVRDLNPEEMAVAPTAIALYNGETEVTEAIELTATANTVTLTPSYTPADASEGYITWASSDETVATVVDGVVTGVAPGTATITATSTLDANVSATATVTVSYPESTIPATYETIDGATKTVYTLAQTNLFKNGSFEYPNRVFGWKATNYSTDAVVSNFTFNANGGVNDGAYITTSAGGAGTATSIRQAAAVEAGKTYYFAVYTSGKAPSSNNFQYNALFKMSNATTENGVLKQFEWPQGADKTTSEWTKTEYVFTATAENPFVGVRMSWNSDSRFDEFVLAEVTETKTYDLSATAEDYAALQTAIEDAPALGFQANEAAPYNNITALNTLAAAKAIDPEGDNTHDDVVAATNALKEAKWTTNTEEVNAFFDGTFAKDYSHEGNVMPTGWHGVGDKDNATNVRLMWNNTSNQGLNATSSKQAAFLKYTGIYGNETGYTLPLKAGLYQLEFIYGGWNEQGTRTIKIYNDDNEAAVTPSNVTALDNKAHTTESSWSTYKGYVEIPADGDYIFSFYRQNTTSQNQFVFSDIVLKKAVAEDVTIEETADYTPAEKYANVTFNRTLVEGWNGMVLPFDMSVDDVKATFNASKVKDFKSVTVTDGKATLEFEDATVVKAGKPFMMKADEAGTSYTISGVLLPATGLQPVSKESGDVKYTFTGSYAASTDLSNVVFALIQGDKYYYHNTGKSSSAKAFRAWFVNESTDEAGSRISFNFGDDVITGINEVQTNGQDAEAVYNLQGQRVVNAKKGLFIQNGKKVVIK